jgi:alpha-beta hydrolase superfamily lysophospholipase
MMYEIRDITATDGYKLQYYVWGDNDVNDSVVFYIPGYMSHTLWQEPQLQELAKQGYKVVGIDRRGGGINNHGEAGDAPSIDQLLEDHDTIINREAGGGPMHIWGWCLGGVFAINYICRAQNKINSLLLTTPSIFPQEHLVKRALKIGAHPIDENIEKELPLAIKEDDFTKGAALYDFILKDKKRTKRITSRFYRIQKLMCQYAWVKVQGKSLKIPTRLILAKRDVIVNNEMTENVFKSLENCEIHYIDTEHGIQFENSPVLMDSVCSWLNGRAKENFL